MMHPERIVATYFSATGTTEKIVTYVAEKLADAWQAPLERHDFTNAKCREEAAAFRKSDFVVFGLPVYAGRVPNVLLPYLNEKLSGNGALAAPIVLFGNRNYDDALIELRNLLIATGFQPIAGAAFVGEHSFSYELAAGRPDEKDMAIAARFADRIARIVSREQIPSSIIVSVTGEEPIRAYYRPQDRHGNPIDILKVHPKVGDTCMKCGLCVQVCPMNSINADDVATYSGICIKCGACIKKCSRKARYFDDAGYLYHKEELEAMYARRAEPEVFFCDEAAPSRASI